VKRIALFTRKLAAGGTVIRSVETSGDHDEGTYPGDKGRMSLAGGQTFGVG
jgi:hypothetical protein